jgi:hypothetical protein
MDPHKHKMADSYSESDDSAPAESSSEEEEEEEAAEEEEEAAEEEKVAEPAQEVAVDAIGKKAAWRAHPARKLLLEEFKNGNIPLDYNREGSANQFLKPRAIFDLYKNSDPFAGLESKGFASRLNSLRLIVARRNQREVDDLTAFQVFRKNFPVEPYNHRGELRWDQSAAQRLLKEDIQNEKHLEFGRPKLFWLSRPEYQLFKLSIFRGHINQEERYGKLGTFLKRRKENTEED